MADVKPLYGICKTVPFRFPSIINPSTEHILINIHFEKYFVVPFLYISAHRTCFYSNPRYLTAMGDNRTWTIWIAKVCVCVYVCIINEPIIQIYFIISVNEWLNVSYSICAKLKVGAYIEYICIPAGIQNPIVCTFPIFSSGLSIYYMSFNQKTNIPCTQLCSFASWFVILYIIIGFC